MAANIFNSVKGLHPKRNKFTADTYRNDFTAPIGANIPVFLKECLPAERVKVSASALCRLQALIAPVMDNIDYYVHFWKMPYRLLENDRFTAFISGEIEADDYDALFATPYELAQVVSNLITGDDKEATYNNIFGNGSLLDFLGYDRGLFPDLVYDEDKDIWVLSGGNNVNKLNWRGLIAYYMLHVNWYMNENVPYFENFVEIVDTLIKEQSLSALGSLMVSTNGMFNDTNKYALLPHGWEKDYFTAALPNVQSGDPVSLPIAGTAPVSMNPVADYVQMNGDGNLQSNNGLGGLPSSTNALVINNGKLCYSSVVEGETIYTPVTQLSGSLSAFFESMQGFDDNDNPVAGFIADLSEATAITINELRFANALQVFKERQLRYGKRRTEYYKGFFDVEPEDLRLQVPKYLGGGRIPINITDIEQTSATSGSQALGHIAGKGTAVAGGFAGFSTFCSEESVIIGIAFAMPHITYAQQLSKFKMKTNDRYDYFNPSFEHLGEQEIKNVEIFAGASNPNGVFGYTPRYTEYRFHLNEMHGEFKSSLAFWSLGRIFSEQPALNAEFVYMQPSAFDRIFAVANQPNLVVSMLFHVRSIKPVSRYGTPMLLA